mmetsp:Transcript_3301/g.7726  ORF Transcript_3301/g.7726 Transcript_3301/m.7726 type:complete len:242 (-) Transcript_3301:348-1073(-)
MASAPSASSSSSTTPSASSLLSLATTSPAFVAKKRAVLAFMNRRIGEGNEVVAVVGHYMRKRDWIGSIRSPDQCFIPQNFKIPPHADEMKHRLYRNLQYFLSNYVLFALFVLFYGIFRSTVALFCVIILCIGWHYGLQLKHIRIGDVVLAETYKLWSMAIVSLIVLLLCAGHVLLWIVVFSCVPIVSHATLHIPMSAAMSKKDDDIDPEDPGDGASPKQLGKRQTDTASEEPTEDEKDRLG